MWQTCEVRPAYDVLAPDGSEIRLLLQVSGGSMVHCTLQPGQVTRAVRHRTVDELWFCESGSGQLWRRSGEQEEIVELRRGVALSIPPGVAFQFRAGSLQAVEVVIATLPAWPGEEEAVPADGIWEATL